MVYSYSLTIEVIQLATTSCIEQVICCLLKLKHKYTHTIVTITKICLKKCHHNNISSINYVVLMLSIFLTDEFMETNEILN